MWKMMNVPSLLMPQIYTEIIEDKLFIVNIVKHLFSLLLMKNTLSQQKQFDQATLFQQSNQKWETQAQDTAESRTGEEEIK